MDIDFIRREWAGRQTDEAASKKLWGVMAKDRTEMLEDVKADDFSLGIVVKKSMVDESSTVFDLGCGEGRYAKWFARRCGRVLATDLSEQMLERSEARLSAAGCKNVELRQMNWHQVDLDEAGLRGAFDLSFANATPAIQSAATFEAFCATSRNWCFMSKPAHRKDELTKAILKDLGIPDTGKSLDEDMAYAFDLLYLSGRRPEVAYCRNVWESHRTLEEAERFYTAWIDAIFGLPEEKRPLVRESLASMAQNGSIDYAEEVTMTALYWNVNA